VGTVSRAWSRTSSSNGPSVRPSVRPSVSPSVPSVNRLGKHFHVSGAQLGDAFGIVPSVIGSLPFPAVPNVNRLGKYCYAFSSCECAGHSRCPKRQPLGQVFPLDAHAHSAVHVSCPKRQPIGQAFPREQGYSVGYMSQTPTAWASLYTNRRSCSSIGCRLSQTSTAWASVAEHLCFSHRQGSTWGTGLEQLEYVLLDTS
jgi:hypothetical protein